MFELRKLPFDANANAVVSAKTCEYHYGKHHATYVANLNNLIKDTKFANASFYEILKNSEMSSELKTAIEANFANFKEEFLKAATTLFGSGWAWLVFDPSSKKLEIVQTSNAKTPVSDGKVPLLVVDVWEHAYYIDNFNARPKYLETFYENINWEFVSQAYEWAQKEGLGSVEFYTKELHK